MTLSASTTSAADDTVRLEQQALAAMQGGQVQQAVQTWQQLLQIAPDHTRALTHVGQFALHQGDVAGACRAFRRVAELDGRDPHQWINLAMAQQRLGDTNAEEEALRRALTADPYDLLALLLRGQLYERQGRQHEAASAYGAASTVAPPLERLTPGLRPAVEHARQFHDRHQQAFAEFLDRYLAPHLQDCDAAALQRFQLSLDILVGRKRRHDAQPMRYFVPQLAPVEFFDRALFPWLDAIEAGTEAIRDECLAVLRSDRGLEPYIQYAPDQPVAQWAELNHSSRWSAIHLVKDGQPMAGNAERCPRTMALWRDNVPAPDQPGRTPVALFSVLKPKTRIPAHVGASNARLLVHLPLVIPPGCNYRVGNTLREWVEGRAWVFDDTIEHEAWNGSDQIRVVMIFDTWHPGLNADERRMITALSAALNAFNSGSAGGYDG
ncbi:MAG: aspartyl/asparaginyl beta-hydroxylase domain-containing protein [Rubrivivax sp.]